MMMYESYSCWKVSPYAEEKRQKLSGNDSNSNYHNSHVIVSSN